MASKKQRDSAIESASKTVRDCSGWLGRAGDATIIPRRLRLWDVDHPFYAQEGNYYSNDCHTEYDSWSEFFDEYGDSDPDMNLVYRWDWQRPDPDEDPPYDENDTLSVFFVGQRKAILQSATVVVQESDEPQVREWLEERAKTITAIWRPINL